MPTPLERVLAFGHDSRTKLLDGVRKAVKLVGATLGPGGRLILIWRFPHPPFYTKDGVTVFEDIVLDDPFEDAAVQIAKKVSRKTCNEGGDGTTTAAVLTLALLEAGMEAVEAKANPVHLKKGIDAAVEAAIAKLSEMKQEATDEDIRKVARISANSDPELADHVSQAVITAGKDGAVVIDSSEGLETYVQAAQGCELFTGWVSNLFVTDQKTATSALEDCYVLLLDKKFQSIADMLPLINDLCSTSTSGSKPLFVISETLEGEALATLAAGHVQKNMRCCAVKTPGYKEAGRELLEDIASLTGATVISDELGLSYRDIRREHLGRAQTVKVTQTTTTIVGGHANYEKLEDRKEEIRLALEREKDPSQQDRLQQRLSRLGGGVQVIRIGGSSEVEVLEKAYRAEDAMHAVRSAQKSGIVEGAGMALSRASGALQLEGNKDFMAGVAIVKQAMTRPRDLILENAGYKPEEVLAEMPQGYGFDAMLGKYGDLRSMGIVDPFLVVSQALRNAASVAGSMLLTEGAIVPKR